MIQLLKNARLAASVISQHLVDDPVLLYLQAARRLPAVVRPFGRVAAAVFPRNSVAVPVILAALSNGNDADAKRRLELAADGPTRGNRPGALRTLPCPPACWRYRTTYWPRQGMLAA